MIAPAPGSAVRATVTAEEVIVAADPVVEEPSPLAPGEPIAGTPFVVVRLLGQGGMGEVYEVEHAALRKRAAVKVLHRRHHQRADLAVRLRDEARLAARLHHANLVEVFDLGVTEDGRPWFAMPLLRGRDLREELSRSGPLCAAKAIGLAVQALDGLAVAHAEGLVHRDVKLENLFLEESGTLKVLDFGVAKATSRAPRTDPGAPAGTPRSMAPEQCVGAGVDARADVYAVGLVLYELLTGRGPFDDFSSNDHALRFAHCTRAPLAPSRLAPGPLPPALDALVLRALAKSPSERFPSAPEMARALRRLLARPRGRARTTRRSPASWQTVAASALAVAFFALGLAFGRMLPPAGAPDPAPITALTKL